MKKSNFMKNRKKDYIKISILGDLMCDNALLNAASNSNGDFDFSHVFSNIRDYLSKADYCVANFETVLGGNPPWTAIGSIYNTPDQFAIDIKNAGIDMLLTANNHIWDKGYEGAKRTTEYLKSLGFDVVGTFDKRQPFRIELFGIKICFLAYTESINFKTSEDDFNCVISGHVNMLAPLPSKREFKKTERDMYKGFNGAIKYIVRKILKMKLFKPIMHGYNKYRLKNKKSTLNARTDVIEKRHGNENILDLLKSEVEIAKNQSDIIIVNAHAGGQLNKKPGEYIEFLRKFYKELGVDALLCNHPHVIQEADFSDGFLMTASLGSPTQTPDGEYKNNPLKPYYSMAINIYIGKEKKCIEKVTFTIIRAIADENRYVYLFPIEKLYEEKPDMRKEIEKDVEEIYHRVTGKYLTKNNLIKAEYLL